jgi:hypothetical protein
MVLAQRIEIDPVADLYTRLLKTEKYITKTLTIYQRFIIISTSSTFNDCKEQL